jgi:tRNA threonylcarbamoyladenosine biosynthesis protein TsaE
MMQEWHVADEQALPVIASAILRNMGPSRVLLLSGELGAGKTTLVRELCLQLGVLDRVQSPTFSIVNEYHTKDGEPVYHFDFYRLKNAEGALDLGYEEYLYSGYFCFVEWPGQVPGLGWPPCAEVIISHAEHGRTICLNNEQRNDRNVSNRPSGDAADTGKQA